MHYFLSNRFSQRLSAIFFIVGAMLFSLSALFADGAFLEAAPAELGMMANTDIDAELARTQILSGVVQLQNGGTSGALVAYGDTAYVIADVPDKDHYSPMIVAAGWGTGRVMAMGHSGWPEMDSLGDLADNGQFYENSLAWLADNSDKTINIVVTSNTAAETWLANQGYTNVVKMSATDTYTTALAGADVLVGAIGTSVPQIDLDNIEAFVTGGGGFFTADTSWIYGPYYQHISEAPLNLLLRDAGIGLSDDYDYHSGTVEPSRGMSQTTSTDIADMLTNPISYTEQEQTTYFEVLDRIYRILPGDDPLVTQFDGILTTKFETYSPTPNNPISDLFAQAVLGREADFLAKTPPAQVVVHRVAEEIYGIVPITVPRVTETVTLDTTVSRWHATGLYANAGEVVTVTVPVSMTGQGFQIRINAHSDDISARDDWERPPVVHRSFEITSTVTEAASGFGGLIFIDFGSTPADIGLVEVVIENAVEAPYFDLSKHTDRDWTVFLRQRPAPYGVFVSENLIVSLPKAQIEAADLEFPSDLMAWWSETVRLQDELSDQAQFRTSPELANVDVQISVGAAHSGYPYQIYEKYWGNMADWDNLRELGSWGDFHELGHNHQRGWWTFDGDVEVSVNIFSNYSLETQAENPDLTSGWGYSVDPVLVIERANQAVLPGGTYSSKSDRWPFWFQLADGFGWETYNAVFSGYEDDNKINQAALPTTDQEEKEQWLVRWSQEVGYDVSPFMVDTWGLQVGQAALDEIAGLPKWMPLEGEPIELIVPKGGSASVNISNTIHSMAGMTLTAVGEPAADALTVDGEIWTYTPPVSSTAVTDQFTYTAVSNVGNSRTFTASVVITNRGVLRETWHDVSGTSVADLTSAAAYPDSPDEVTVSADFTAPTGMADSYGTRMRAWLQPTVSGTYTFSIASDDEGALLLSSDHLAANAVQIATVTGWSDEQDWNGAPEQTSGSIELIAGNNYYIEALMKEDGGSDHLSVAWQGPGIEQAVIPGDVLRPYVTGPVFEAPVAVSDQIQTAEDQPITIDLLSNDYDIDGDTVSFVGIAAGSYGSYEINNGTLSYTPTLNYFGTEQLAYTVTDSRDGVSTGSVSLVVTSVNDAPVAVNDVIGVKTGQPTQVDVLDNDSDVEDEELTVVSVGTPSVGTVELAGGIVTYSPAVGYTGPDSFSYTIADSGNVTASGTVTVIVSADGGIAYRIYLPVGLR